MDRPGDTTGTGLQISNSVENSFKEAAAWAKFIAIAGMTISAIAVVMSFTLGGRIETALNEGFIRSGTAGYLWVMIILVFAVAFFILCIYLFRFANRMQVAILNSDRFEFVEAMRNLRNAYKAMAIVFSVYFLAFIGVSLAGFLQ